MRILLSNEDRTRLFQFLKVQNDCHSLMELSKKIKIPLRTIQNWVYISGRYIPDKIIPQEIKKEIKILDQQKDNWGNILGGKKTYKIIIEKYGEEEMKRRRSKGGKISRAIQVRQEKNIAVDLTNPLFLEFYGVLLGDGWLSRLSYKNKKIWILGISGHMIQDREFFIYLRKNILDLFQRKAYLKVRPKFNSIELNFGHKSLIKLLNNELGFPIGKKIDLKIEEKIYSLGYEYVKYVIRGVFDTDGSFYFDKTPSGNPYPCISIKMKAPQLIKQIKDILIKQGFKVSQSSYDSQEQIKLKGHKQLEKWMREIGSSNPKHLNKIALVAQPG